MSVVVVIVVWVGECLALTSWSMLCSMARSSCWKAILSSSRFSPPAEIDSGGRVRQGGGRVVEGWWKGGGRVMEW